MDDIAIAQRAEGTTPRSVAEQGLRAVQFRHPREADGLTVVTLGDAAHEQVGDLITDLLHLIDLSGADWQSVLDDATGHFLAEPDDA